MVKNMKVGEKVWLVLNEYSAPMLVLCTVEHVEPNGDVWVDEPLNCPVSPDEVYASINDALPEFDYFLSMNVSDRGNLRNWRKEQVDWLKERNPEGKFFMSHYLIKVCGEDWFNGEKEIKNG